MILVARYITGMILHHMFFHLKIATQNIFRPKINLVLHNFNCLPNAFMDQETISLCPFIYLEYDKNLDFLSRFKFLDNQL